MQMALFTNFYISWSTSVDCKGVQKINWTNKIYQTTLRQSILKLFLYKLYRFDLGRILYFIILKFYFKCKVLD